MFPNSKKDFRVIGLSIIINFIICKFFRGVKMKIWIIRLVGVFDDLSRRLFRKTS